MDLKELCLGYFKSFTAKDIEGLKGVFSEDVTLRDWEVEVKGMKKVIETNEKIFSEIESIEVVPKVMYQENDTVISEIEVIINKDRPMLVVDIIEFNNGGKIKSIRAYKGS